MLSARFFWPNAKRSIASPAARCNHVAAQSKQGALNAIISQTSSNGAAGSGQTVAIKDNIVTTSLPTTASSAILSDYTSPFNATVVELLQAANFTISQKTSLDEFGMGSHNQHAASGPALSTFSRQGVALSPGGSSGGSAIAVATGECWAALGTDTGGSVRLPAAYMGLVGFKPSYGLVSRWGVIQYANSLDTVGVLTKEVEDARKLFRCLSRYDERDPTSLPVSVRERIGSGMGKKGRSLRIGIPKDYNIEELSPVVRESYAGIIRMLQSAGHTLHSVSLPSTRQALSAYYVLAPAEASSNLAKYDGIRYGKRSAGPDATPKSNLPLYAETRGEKFGDEVKRRILLGAYTLSSEAMDNYFVQAQKVRRQAQQDFDRVFAKPNPLLDAHESSTSAEEGVDILLTPTAPTLPPTVDEVKKQSPVESYMNDVFTVPASLAGLPAISVPAWMSEEAREGMETSDVNSIGMQIIGQFGDDEAVLDAAAEIEKLQSQR